MKISDKIANEMLILTP